MRNLIKQTWIPIVIIGTIILAIYTVNTVVIPNIPSIYTNPIYANTYKDLMYKIEMEGTGTVLYYFNITQYLRNLNQIDELASKTISLNDIIASVNQGLPKAPSSSVDVIAWLRYIAKIIPNVLIMGLNATVLLIGNIIIEIINILGIAIITLNLLLGVPTEVAPFSYVTGVILTSIPPIQPIPFI